MCLSACALKCSISGQYLRRANRVSSLTLVTRSAGFVGRLPLFVASGPLSMPLLACSGEMASEGRTMLNRRRLVGRIGLFAALAACGLPAFAQEAPQQAPDSKAGKKYVCPPCGCGEDHKEYDAPGACPACGMPLVEKAQPAPASPPQTSSPQTPPPSSTNVGDAAPAKRDTKQNASPPAPQ
jgi:Heavy metal binding domain